MLERVLDFLAEAAPEISGPDGVHSYTSGFFRAQIRPEPEAEKKAETQKKQSQKQRERLRQRERQ